MAISARFIDSPMELPRYKDLTPDQMKIFQSLSCARDRCTNKNNNRYYRYGARGIEYRLEKDKTRGEVVLEQEAAWMKAKRKYKGDAISINRIDNNGHYEEGNIEWITVSENSKQMHLDNKGNPNMKNHLKNKRKIVECVTTGDVFESTMFAGRETGIKPQNISLCCKGKVKSAGKTKDGRKMVWRFV